MEACNGRSSGAVAAPRQHPDEVLLRALCLGDAFDSDEDVMTVSGAPVDKLRGANDYVLVDTPPRCLSPIRARSPWSWTGCSCLSVPGHRWWCRTLDALQRSARTRRPDLSSSSSWTSASTMILTSSGVSTFGSQPSSCLAFE